MPHREDTAYGSLLRRDDSWRGRTPRCDRVGKISRRRAIVIAVPGNFAHPTLSPLPHISIVAPWYGQSWWSARRKGRFMDAVVTLVSAFWDIATSFLAIVVLAVLVGFI